MLGGDNDDASLGESQSATVKGSAWGGHANLGEPISGRLSGGGGGKQSGDAFLKML
jgi:hypothetical protein